MSEDSLAANILLAGARGQLSLEEAGAMMEVLAGAPILRPVDRTTIGGKTIYMAQDSTGKTLVSDKNYKLRGKKVKVLREEFGGGNMLDTYYRITYLNTELEEKFECIDARYPNGVFGGAVYRAPFGIFDPLEEMRAE